MLSKSCSRSGWSLMFKAQTLQKSVRTPNGNGARKCKRSFPAPSPDALFRARDYSLVDFGVPGRSQNCLRLQPGKSFRWDSTFLGVTFFSTLLRLLRLGVFRKGPGAIPEAPGTLPSKISDVFSDMFRCFLLGSVRDLAGSAGGLPERTGGLRYVFSGVPLG